MTENRDQNVNNEGLLENSLEESDTITSETQTQTETETEIESAIRDRF